MDQWLQHTDPPLWALREGPCLVADSNPASTVPPQAQLLSPAHRCGPFPRTRPVWATPCPRHSPCPPAVPTHSLQTFAHVPNTPTRRASAASQGIRQRRAHPPSVESATARPPATRRPPRRRTLPSHRHPNLHPDRPGLPRVDARDDCPAAPPHVTPCPCPKYSHAARIRRQSRDPPAPGAPAIRRKRHRPAVRAKTPGAQKDPILTLPPTPPPGSPRPVPRGCPGRQPRPPPTSPLALFPNTPARRTSAASQGIGHPGPRARREAEGARGAYSCNTRRYSAIPTSRSGVGVAIPSPPS
jgi:hypothetical protein